MSESRSRRAFLQATAAAAAGTAATAAAAAAATEPRPGRATASPLLPIVRPPDRVFAHVEGERLALETGASGEWARGGVHVETTMAANRLAVRAASDLPFRRLHLRWSVARPPGLGRWGFEMGPSMTVDGWSFADRSRTSAEIVRALYSAIREAAGPAVVIGCNTIGHLGAGLFELQRTGDDTSGREWERTRKMGVNTMAFRLPQHGAFFAADADCAPITKALPWALAERWLRLVAASGTPLFLSHTREALGPEQKAAVRAAFALAAVPQPPPEPLDWIETTCPRRWRLGGHEVAFEWTGEGGVETA